MVNEIYEGGVAAADGRLRVGDQILEVSLHGEPSTLQHLSFSPSLLVCWPPVLLVLRTAERGLKII